jgi:adenylate kinase family enzyme
MSDAMNTKAEQLIIDNAITHARKTKKPFARAETSKDIFSSEKNPITILMAGSPGAGKTETAQEILNIIGKAIHVDPDRYRDHFKDYIGDNAYLFQAATSILVEKVVDFALKNRQSFILDGTLTKYEIARQNIQRALGRDRKVIILYVYQDPIVAWHFVKAREKVEGRRIQLNTFVAQYFEARAVVNKLKAEFNNLIQLEILIKNTASDPSKKSMHSYINGASSIDPHIPEQYTCDQLRELIEE